MNAQVAVELLLVPECRHAGAARTLLAQCLDELPSDARRAATVVERVGEFSSPTILVNGRDVTSGDVPPGVASCRLRLPTVSQVRRALRDAVGSALAGAQPADTYPAQLSVGVTRDRLAGVTPAARAVHRAILLAFAACGTAPDRVALAAAVNLPEKLDGVLTELHEHDVIRLDEQGGIRVAYPFSGVPTAHVVHLDGGRTVYAMCAIDALGMSEMLGRDVTIASADPGTGQPIEVQVRGRGAVWTPEAAVVVVGSKVAGPAAEQCCARQDTDAVVLPAADRCCGVMNFFASTADAQRWLDGHRDVAGVILNQGQALRLGRDIFGRLLDTPPDLRGGSER